MLTDRETDQLVAALGACQAIRDEAQRALIIDSLPPAIQMRLVQASTLHAQLLRLLGACQEHPGGLSWLRTRLRRLEGDGARTMAAVDAVLRAVHERLSPCLLMHRVNDRDSAEHLARWLHTEGVAVWLDSWNLTPVDPWPRPLADALDECATCAVLMGPGREQAQDPWRHEDVGSAIAERVASGALRVIPVRLPGARRHERSLLPRFLIDSEWVEFEQTLDEPVGRARLLDGIRPERSASDG